MQKTDHGPVKTGCWRIKQTFDQAWPVSPVLVLTEVSILLQTEIEGIISSFESLGCFQVLCDSNHAASCTLTLV